MDEAYLGVGCTTVLYVVWSVSFCFPMLLCLVFYVVYTFVAMLDMCGFM